MHVPTFLKTTSTTSTANWLPIDCHLTVTQLSHNCHSTTTWLSLDCHLTTTWLSVDKKVSKVIHLQVFRIVRVPPLNIFGESSRPIRSQDSMLSTNQRPWFKQNIRHQLNLNPPTVPLQCHCVTQLPFDYHLTVTWLPLDFHLTLIWLPLNWQCHWTTTRLPLDCHLAVIWHNL